MQSWRRSIGRFAAAVKRRLGFKDVVILCLSAILAGFLTLAYFAYNLPISDAFGSDGRRMSLLLLAADDEAFASRGKFRGKTLGVQDIPADLMHAAVAIEDRRFYNHSGIDPRGMARAALTNLMAGGIRQGGSTITQQLAKVMFLSPERTFRRKLQELMLAFWLEHHLTKDEILVRYLNAVYFGAGAYGVDGAARRYFNKPVQSLSLSEAAMLAGLIRSPSYLAPTRNLKAAQDRAEVVLAAMVRTGYLSEDEAAAAKAEPAKPALPPDSSPGANYFADWIQAEAQRQLGSLSADLAVETTFDPELQDLAERIVSEWLDAEGERGNVDQAGLVAMTADGAVLAMVGGLDYGTSQFNRATQARRQPGSVFKLAVYLAAFDAGLRPDAVFVDEPLEIDGWRPENYSGEYQGPVSLRTAFAKSINTVAVQLTEEVGRDRVIGVARRLGIGGNLRPVPSLALGSAEVTLLEMTAAYAAIAAGVQRVEPFGIRTIRGVHGRGRVIHRHKPPPDQRRGSVLPWKREEMVDLLMTTMREGTGRAAALGRPAAGKTGTSQDYRDAWFVGFTADLVVGVWVGNDDARPMNGVTGGGLPARIWRDFMDGTYALKGATPVAASARTKPLAAVEAKPSPPLAPPPRPADAAAAPSEQPASGIDRIGQALRSIFD